MAATLTATVRRLERRGILNTIVADGVRARKALTALGLPADAEVEWAPDLIAGIEATSRREWSCQLAAARPERPRASSPAVEGILPAVTAAGTLDEELFRVARFEWSQRFPREQRWQHRVALPEVQLATVEALTDPRWLALVDAGVLAVWAAPGDGSSTVVVPRPQVRLDATGRRHSIEEPVAEWPNGRALWFWEEIWIPEAVGRKRGALDPEDVLQERNAERRRLYLQQIGYERFLQAGGAVLVQQDDYGRLWRLDSSLDEAPLVVLDVVDATPLPDGARRRYHLRVPPETRTAREAVAWTFGFDSAAAYQPQVET